MKIALGTTSELKIRACKLALSRLDIDAEIIAVKAGSGVSDQPFGFDEIITGAKNRSIEAKNKTENVDFSIGIESGLLQITEIQQWFDVPCICVISKEGQESFSFGSFYYIPDWMERNVKEDETELGFIVQKMDSTAEKDPIGYFSSGKINRDEIITQAIMCALVKVLNPDRYLEKKD